MTGYSSTSLMGIHNTLGLSPPTPHQKSPPSLTTTTESLILHHDSHLEDMREDILLSPGEMKCGDEKINIVGDEPNDNFHSLPCGFVLLKKQKQKLIPINTFPPLLSFSPVLPQGGRSSQNKSRREHGGEIQ